MERSPTIARDHKSPPYNDVIKWKHFPPYWPFMRGIHRSPVNSPQRGQWHGASMFSLICAWINGWVNNRESGDLRRHRANYDVTAIPSRCIDHTYLTKCYLISYGTIQGTRWNSLFFYNHRAVRARNCGHDDPRVSVSVSLSSSPINLCQWGFKSIPQIKAVSVGPREILI